MAASLQGFVSGMVNVVTAGVIAPALFHDPRLLAAGMLGLAVAGFVCWNLYLRVSRRVSDDPPTILPEPRDGSPE